MKIILTTILLITAIWSHGQTSYDKKQDLRLYNLEQWQKTVNLKLKNDSISIAWLKGQVNTLVTQNNSQQTQINSLLSLTATQANDITNLNTAVISHGIQIRSLQDSLAAIPFVLVDTVKVAGKQSLTFRTNTLSVTK